MKPKLFLPEGKFFSLATLLCSILAFTHCTESTRATGGGEGVKQVEKWKLNHYFHERVGLEKALSFIGSSFC